LLIHLTALILSRISPLLPPPPPTPTLFPYTTLFRSLGRTAINGELIETLTNEPANFWYFNNGVTILCESVERSSQSIRSPQSKPDRKSTRLNSSHVSISYAVFCLKKKITHIYI